jgi:dolichol-phosphate mannosyltransferase
MSYKLLRLSIYFGFILALIAIVISIFIIIRYFYQDFNPGWPSIIVAILFSTGMILISLGIVGIYIGKILEQSKRNPFFIVQNEINFK